MTDAPETLRLRRREGENVDEVLVWREVAEDALGIESISGEQFGDWVESNAERLISLAERKRAAMPHEIVSGAIHIKPGDRID